MTYYKSRNVHLLPGLANVNDRRLQNLRTLSNSRPLPANAADIVVVLEDFEKPGVEREYLVFISGNKVHVINPDNWKTWQVRAIGVTPVGSFGAGWNYGGRVFMSENGGRGVYEVVTSTIDLRKRGPTVKVKRAGSSDKTNHNDGMNCMWAPPPQEWGATPVPRPTPTRPTVPSVSRVQPFNCKTGVGPIQVKKNLRTRAYDVSQLVVKTGRYTPVYTIPLGRTRPAFDNLNSVAVNPIDGRAYGTLQVNRRNYLVRFDAQRVEFVARMPPAHIYISGAFSLSGVFYFNTMAHPRTRRMPVFSKVPDLHTRPGFTNVNDRRLQNLRNVASSPPLAGFNAADIVVVLGDFESLVWNAST